MTYLQGSVHLGVTQFPAFQTIYLGSTYYLNEVFDYQDGCGH